MGFFSELKEDLSQAMNELVTEGGEEMENVFAPEARESILPETSEDLGRMLESMDLDALVESEEMTDSFSEEIPAEMPESFPEETPAEVSEETPEEIPAGLAETPAEEQEIEENIAVTQEKVQMEEAQYMSMEPDNMRMTGDVTDETAIITAGMVIKGDISSQGSLDVVGSVEGNIEILGKLNITGTIDGASKAADVYAEKARINGDVQSSASIKIGQNTIIIGNIYATSAIIAGAVKGDIDVKGPVVLDNSAIVMGNIKSKSVQINNGAVIEGLCSQCYADVNPSSFFEDIKKARK